SGNSKPAFIDADGDGDLDSVVGSIDGNLTLFRNDAPLGRQIEINVTDQPERPSLIDVDANVSYLVNDLLGAPVVLDSDVDLRLGSADLAGGRLIISGLLPTDRIAVVEDSVITVLGNEVSYNGTVIGTFTGGQGTPFIVSFGANAGE